MLSFTTDLSTLNPISSVNLSASVPLSIGRPVMSDSMTNVMAGSSGSASSSAHTNPSELHNVVQNKLVNSLQITFDELGPLPPG